MKITKNQLTKIIKRELKSIQEAQEESPPIEYQRSAEQRRTNYDVQKNMSEYMSGKFSAAIKIFLNRPDEVDPRTVLEEAEKAFALILENFRSIYRQEDSNQ